MQCFTMLVTLAKSYMLHGNVFQHEFFWGLIEIEIQLLYLLRSLNK